MVVIVFQPHRYTRTAHLFEEFGSAFKDADIVILADVYSAGESPIAGISGETILNEIQKHNKEAVYFGKKENIAGYVVGISRPNDIIITMGAGDINNVGKEIFSRLKGNVQQ